MWCSDNDDDDNNIYLSIIINNIIINNDDNNDLITKLVVIIVMSNPPNKDLWMTVQDVNILCFKHFGCQLPTSVHWKESTVQKDN